MPPPSETWIVEIQRDTKTVDRHVYNERKQALFAFNAAYLRENLLGLGGKVYGWDMNSGIKL